LSGFVVPISADLPSINLTKTSDQIIRESKTLERYGEKSATRYRDRKQIRIGGGLRKRDEEIEDFTDLNRGLGERT
jgi:uncharacterized protein YifE (UPF0438 family)